MEDLWILYNIYIIAEPYKLLVRIESIPFCSAVPEHVQDRQIGKECEKTDRHEEIEPRYKLPFGLFFKHSFP